MARPRSAWASAAASLTPSPTIATTRPLGLQVADHVDLVVGQHLGDDLVDADLGGDRAGRPLVVAGEQDRLEAELAQPAHGLGRGRLDRVGDHEHARGPGRPSPTTTAVRPGRAALATADCRSAGTREPSSASSSGRPTTHLVAVDRARGRRARSRLREVARPRRCRPVARRHDGPADRVLRGGLERRRPAAAPRRRPRRRAATTSTSVIRPVVTVPVLSSTTVSTRRVDSSTSGPWIRMPSWAPRPVPTISAVGVARPSAHGQAMISTATAAVNAVAGPAPVPSQKPSVPTASAITTGTKTPEIRSASRWTCGLAVLGVLDQPGHLRQLGVGADPGRPHDQPAAGVDRGADHRRRPGRPRPAPTRRSASRRRPPRCRSRRRRRWRSSRPAGPRTRRRPPARSTGHPRPRRRRAARATSLAPSSSSARSAAPARRLARFSK